MKTTHEILEETKAALPLLTASRERKNAALLAIADRLIAEQDEILAANRLDVEGAKDRYGDVMMDRLTLTLARIEGMAQGVREVAALPDPEGRVLRRVVRPNGLVIEKTSVPLGVVAIIYESRPNVTVDAFALAYKSGNAILLRGSSSALKSNKAIVAAIKEGLASSEAQGFGVVDSIELAPCESHSEVEEILTAVGKIDVALPRGSAKLINMVVQTAKIPVIETGAGICHIYVDETGDLEMAENIAWNAKTQRPGVCNAIECILVHEKVAQEFLPRLAKRFAGKVELRCDQKSYEICANLCKSVDCKIVPAEEADFDTEFLDLICAVKVVSDVNEAIAFINNHNTKHSESIITESRANARLFQAKVDAACVYVNCSTRFTDGGEFGFGAELGISTQKLHARGPMGIKALTTTKYLIDGDGQVR